MSPCYDAQEDDDNRHCHERLTKVTRLLCEVIRSGVSNAMRSNPELEEWWDEHKVADLERGGR